MPADREITLKTPLGDRLLFAALEGQDEIGAPFAFQLSMVGPDPDVDPVDILGKEVTVTVGRDEPVRHIHAVVADFGFSGTEGGWARYRATLRPSLWLLSLTSDNRIFQKKSVPEIVEAVLKQHDVRFEKRLRGSYQPRDYCVQYGESDLDFVLRLLEHEGILLFFEHSEDGHLLVLADDSGRLGPVEGLAEIPWQPDERANFLDGDFVVRWDATSAMRTSKFAHTDYDFEKPSANLLAKSQDGDSHGPKAAEAYRYPGTYVATARGDALADLRIEELQASRRRAVAQVTAPAIWSGASFKLTDFPREAENDAWLVLRARYRMWDGQYQTGMRQAGMGRAEVGCELTLDLQPAAVPFRPERRTPRPRMAGPQTAVVVGPAGEEIFTDKYSRVKVQFHWDRQGKKDQESSCWVRVSSAWAGSGWGFIQIPRIGQEVIVDFLEGDPDQPIITGRVYNAEQMPPYALPANATQSGWKSNSSKGGGGWNELRFEDKKGSEQVYFQAEKDHLELVKNDETRSIGHDWVEEVGHDATQSVGHDRSESVGNDKDTSVGRHRDVQIGANDTETVGGNRSLTVVGNETITVQKSSTETIVLMHTQSVGVNQAITVGAMREDTVGANEARTVGNSHTTTVGNDRSITVGSKQSHAVGSDDSTNIGGAQTLSVAKDQSTSVAGGQTLSVAKDQGTSVAGARSVSVSKDQSHAVTGNIGMSGGKKMSVTVADEIALVCGDASVTLKKDGTIEIKGKDIKIQGSGKINAKADGDIVLKGSNVHAN